MQVRKSILYTGLVLGLSSWSNTPTPDFTARSLINKHTGSGCSTCGTTGWVAMDSLVKRYEGTHLIIGDYSKSSYAQSNTGESMLGNIYSEAWSTDFRTNYLPYFTVNQVDVTGADGQAPSTILGKVTTQIQIQDAKTIPLGMNFAATLIGNQVKIVRYFQSKTTLSGTYSVSTILLEDSVKHYQSPDALGTTRYHHSVFRASPNTTRYGDPLPSQATNGQLYKDSVSIAITSTDIPTWNSKHFQIGLVLWQNGKVINTYTRPISQTWLSFDGSSSSNLSSSSTTSSSSQTTAVQLRQNSQVEWGYRSFRWNQQQNFHWEILNLGGQCIQSGWSDQADVQYAHELDFGRYFLKLQSTQRQLTVPFLISTQH